MLEAYPVKREALNVLERLVMPCSLLLMILPTCILALLYELSVDLRHDLFARQQRTQDQRSPLS